MARRMLIDGGHPEEPRIVIADDSRLEEFDFETAAHKLLKGNIYLAKVTRVEPSLQAAFVEYGGGRQGFLPFSEIHYDYYQIPTADKEKLKELEGQEAAKDNDADSDAAALDAGQKPETQAQEVETINPAPTTEQASESEEEVAIENAYATVAPEDASDAGDRKTIVEPVEADESVDEMGEDVDEEDDEKAAIRRSQFYRKYKIQDVIKRNQIVLIQVVKEERGNKGASLTTYISIAGRYCVFMPNTPSQGGLSRRISSNEDRRRLRDIMKDLEMPDGGSMIIRTAGVDRNKADIKRDFEYLQKLWGSVRELAVSSEAPALVYEEGSLIKRFIRDMYQSSIQEIVVEGEEVFASTRDTMKMFMPSHVARVKKHEQKTPIFRHYKIDEELTKLYDNRAYLKSGGYIVLNPTEALVSIDVNSGRATKERNVEETATKTNLEAAYEIGRQLRLRDLAGLVVIDFIDMNDGRNRRAVERALKDALSTDRARIQVGRISPFGLLEMSRQRLRSSFLESNTITCAHCTGTGMMRSPDSVAVDVIRAIETEASKGRHDLLVMACSAEVAVYVLNTKRQEISEMEETYELEIHLKGDPSIVAHNYLVDKTNSILSKKRREKKKETKAADAPAPIQLDSVELDDVPEVEEDNASIEPVRNNVEEIGGNRGGRDGRDNNKRRRSRGGRGGRGRNNNRDDRQNNKPANDTDGNKASSGGDNNKRIRYRGGSSGGNREAAASSAPAAQPAEETKSIIRGLWKKITD